MSQLALEVEELLVQIILALGPQLAGLDFGVGRLLFRQHMRTDSNIFPHTILAVCWNGRCLCRGGRRRGRGLRSRLENFGSCAIELLARIVIRPAEGLCRGFPALACLFPSASSPMQAQGTHAGYDGYSTLGYQYNLIY